MISQLALGLLILGGDPVPTQVDAPPQIQVEEVTGEPVSDAPVSEAIEYEGGMCDACCSSGKCKLPGTWYYWWHSRCDMPQHTPYFPAAHGYYYFRPYNYEPIRMHMDFVTSFGGDRRNPYSNAIFDKVYAEIGAEARGEKEAAPMTPPAPKSPSTPAPKAEEEAPSVPAAPTPK